jgi:hypothetical protein
LWSAWFSWLIALAFQKDAVAVWTGVRTALVAEPDAWVSCRSLASWVLVSAGGGGARTREVLASRNGCSTAIQGVCAICGDGGGAQLHRPGCSGPAPMGRWPVTGPQLAPSVEPATGFGGGYRMREWLTGLRKSRRDCRPFLLHKKIHSSRGSL